MPTFKIAAVPPAVADRVRLTREDGYGNRDIAPVRADSHPGYPCRICLRDAAIGEELLLLSYTAFARPAPYQTVGPIFVHLRDCAPYAGGDEIPELLRSRSLVLRAYDAGGRLVEGELVDGAVLEKLADRLFADDRVEKIHIHTVRSGCYLGSLERAGAPAP